MEYRGAPQFLPEKTGEGILGRSDTPLKINSSTPTRFHPPRTGHVPHWEISREGSADARTYPAKLIFRTMRTAGNQIP
jgi:hypothetical protein